MWAASHWTLGCERLSVKYYKFIQNKGVHFAGRGYTIVTDHHKRKNRHSWLLKSAARGKIKQSPVCL